MREHTRDNLVTFREDHPVWMRVFTVNPLVVVGTREESGAYDLAPKHLAMPMGWENYFGFVCTPRHNTDVLVAEVGASPLEPYNGATAIREIGANVCFTVLSASDPYAASRAASPSLPSCSPWSPPRPRSG
jgi:hypothetical protein